MKTTYITPQTKTVVFRPVDVMMVISNPDSLSLGFQEETEEEGYAD
mgnify:CR=1 FL=1